jgi:hypothetical protein
MFVVWTTTESCGRLSVARDAAHSSAPSRIAEVILADAEAVTQAQERFRELIGRGFRAAALSGDGSPGQLLGKFDKEVERTLFIPQLQGG